MHRDGSSLLVVAPVALVLVGAPLTTLAGCGSDGSANVASVDDGGAGTDAGSGTQSSLGTDGGGACNAGSANAEGCPCSVGQSRACYTGPAGTRNVSPCHDGTQQCQGNEFGEFGPCVGDQVPSAASACRNAGQVVDGGSTGDACVPKTCLDLEATCGSVDDGCGGTLQCGTCAAGETCGAGGSSVNPSGNRSTSTSACLTPQCACGGSEKKFVDGGYLTCVNSEPTIIVGIEPKNGQSVGRDGQIKVWLGDECPPTIAPGEQIDPATGAITTPGDRTAKADDGYLWEPALYIAPATVENGGTPHFPTRINGQYNNDPVGFTHYCMVTADGGPEDPRPPSGPGSFAEGPYTAEYVWDVSSLGLSPGTYTAEFVIHDGDSDRGVGCVQIVITP